MMKADRYILMEQATDAGGAGTGEAPPAAPVTPASALAAGAQQEAAPFDWIPEKHRVSKEDGALDLEASARKVADAYAHLSQKLGAGEAPPKTADEYAPQVEVEGFAWDEFKADPESQSFLKGAHAKGITNDQLAFVLGAYANVAPKLVEGAAVLTEESCNTALSEVWKTPAEQKQNLSHAYRAAETFASKIGASFEDIEASGLGNNPMFIRLMAAIGPELGEDTSPNPAGMSLGMSDDDFNTQTADLRSQLAELHMSDKRRPAVQAKLDALYAKRYGTKPQQLGGGAVSQTRA